MDKPKQYVDAGEVRKVVDDVTRGSAILISREWINTRLLSLITTATPIPPDPRYAALRADVVKVREEMIDERDDYPARSSTWEYLSGLADALTAALDAAPGDAPATFPEGIPIQVDAELYYRFKGYRENDMAGEPEETFTIYVTPESSFAPPPSPTVPQVPVSEMENFITKMRTHCAKLPGVGTDKTRFNDGLRAAYGQSAIWINEILAPYRKPPPDAPADEPDGPCSYCGGKGCKACDARCLPADEPCATCGGRMLVYLSKGQHTFPESNRCIPCPDCPPKGEPAPMTPTVEERAAFIVREILRLPDWSPSPQWFAEVLAGERDSIVTAWLAQEQEATDAP